MTSESFVGRSRSARGRATLSPVESSGVVPNRSAISQRYLPTAQGERVNQARPARNSALRPSTLGPNGKSLPSITVRYMVPGQAPDNPHVQSGGVIRASRIRHGRGRDPAAGPRFQALQTHLIKRRRRQVAQPGTDIMPGPVLKRIPGSTAQPPPRLRGFCPPHLWRPDHGQRTQ